MKYPVDASVQTGCPLLSSGVSFVEDPGTSALAADSGGLHPRNTAGHRAACRDRVLRDRIRPPPSLPPAHPRSPACHENATSPASAKFTCAGCAKDGPVQWEDIEKKFREYDEDLVKQWNEEIDTILVFIGLFCGVVTTFNVQFYGQLQPNTMSHSYFQIQVSELVLQLKTDKTLPPDFRLSVPTPIFEPPRSAIIINALWFLSLVLSLISATLGTLVKQWIRGYLAENYSFPRERLRVREHRFSGLNTWAVPHIVALLPLLIRIALTLFLIGMIQFLHTIHPIVMWTVTTPIVLWFLAYAASIVAPAFAPRCPYKSPEAAIFDFLIQSIGKVRHGVAPAVWDMRFSSWVHQERPVKCNANLDIDVLVTADTIFSDQILETSVRSCLRGLDADAVLDFLNHALFHRMPLRSSLSDIEEMAASHRLTAWRLSALSGRGLSAMVDIAVDIMDQQIRLQTRHWSLQPDTMLNLDAGILRCLACLQTLLQFGINLSDVTFENRLLETLGNLLVPTANFELVAREVVNILLARPSMCLLDGAYSALEPVFPSIVRLAYNSITQHTGNPLKVFYLVLSLAFNAPPSVLYDKQQFSLLLDKFSLNVLRTLSKTRLEDIRACIAATEQLSTRFPGLCDELMSVLRARYDSLATTSVLRMRKKRVAEA